MPRFRPKFLVRATTGDPTSSSTTAALEMGKKRKAGGRSDGQSKAPKDNEKTKMTVTTFEDVADSEDEFHINRDKILLDEGPVAKRLRKWKEEGTETV